MPRVDGAVVVDKAPRSDQRALPLRQGCACTRMARARPAETSRGCSPRYPPNSRKRCRRLRPARSPVRTVNPRCVRNTATVTGAAYLPAPQAPHGRHDRFGCDPSHTRAPRRARDRIGRLGRTSGSAARRTSRAHNAAAGCLRWRPAHSRYHPLDLAGALEECVSLILASRYHFSTGWIGEG